jgi:2-keto-4-pentenoate hydratase/2-oxohepta-3-ene-1,7-dioic acid hydratase in catechol pathway
MKQVVLDGEPFEFPIGKILCIGRNYAEHIRELGNEIPAVPVIFMKPASSVIDDGGTIVIPAYSRDCHHEAELALLIGKSGKNIPAEKVMEHVAGFGVALDLTLRDVQSEQKKNGLPWEIAKGFDTACPLSAFVSTAQVKEPQHLNIRLSVNGEVRQDGCTGMMIYPLPELVSYLSGIFTLEAGDIILTGTPAGVGPLQHGDAVLAEISHVGTLRVNVMSGRILNG